MNFKALETIQKERMELAMRKNSDYGHGGVDAIAACGIQGLATRLMDKAARLLSLTRPGYEQKVKDESIRDTLLDIANYSEYGILIIEGTWNPEKSSLAAIIAAHIDDSDSRQNAIEILKKL